MQSRKKWNKVERNFAIGDIVLMYEENLVRAKWPLAKVKTADGKIFRRPIQKVVLLLEA